ncbi:chromosome segregation protein SMC [Smaragdicoccus niigatensis]|uniref:chromosome segregation protein SMC n=1 Tax=Smaragdicoccus niigatensis TaxID=359359 RepID=UPI000374EA7D|nr:chromosome segregation protein SMC [Smaragdicoccus niigatensis]
MHLKSLTLKGFKSFASSTTLRFEPGITCVVGPNGSGKSNVVDALTWVMGEQGAKALRGGKMADVIFAGTAGRAPLGRAEVTLTIDNSDGALPIEYTEVSITRRMFRDGAGEYEINGNSCRLLDIQELLSDSGIGREMHVIVGQGQLSAILESRPEERRAFIEEAAGVLKHRRRKEKAVRKLDAMAANLNRLTDLTAELRRQLKPLGRQAEVARRAQTIQADLRDARLRLAADDLVERRRELAGHEERESVIREQQAEIDAQLTSASEQLMLSADQLESVVPRSDQAAALATRLRTLTDRLDATVRVASERVRHLSQPAVATSGPDPDELEAAADRAAMQEEALQEAVDVAREALAAVAENLADAERIARDAERAHVAAIRAQADRREEFVRLEGQVDSLRARAAAMEGELDRLVASIEEAGERAETAQTAYDAAYVADDEGDNSVDLSQEYDAAVAELRVVKDRVAVLRDRERKASHEVASLHARVDALAVGMAPRDAAKWLARNPVEGVDGLLSDQLDISDGYAAAVAAALGTAADAMVADGANSAENAIGALRKAEAGRAVIAFPAASGALSESGSHRLLDEIRCPAELSGTLEALLGDVVVADDLASAIDAVSADPRVRAVTKAGDVVGAGWVRGGSDRAASPIEVRESVEAARRALRAAEQHAKSLAAELAQAHSDQVDLRETVDSTQAAIREHQRVATAAEHEVSRLRNAAELAAAEVSRLESRRDEVENHRSRVLAELAALAATLEVRAEQAAPESSAVAEEALAQRDDAVAALSAARSAELDARLAVRTAEERASAIRGKADGLRRQAQAERSARARAEHAQRSRRAAAESAQAVVDYGGQLAARVSALLASATSERDVLDAKRAELTRLHSDAEKLVSTLTSRRAALTDSAHRDELARTQIALRVETLESSISDQFGIGLDDLVAEYGPDVELPPTPLEIAEYEAAKERGEMVSAPQPMKFNRAEQERRAKRAAADLQVLGKVNPLALEEFAALEERYNFLSTQLEDVKKARKDLLDVVSDVDARILQLFTEAYTDVEAEFGTVFTTLFPGGEGRLVLTDPSDMLTTGIEVEARPPGKKVKRLSLLSGGEKSLTAVAFLVAIFRARPSPFYVMDEVEAALDDTNLRRLIALFEQLREKSQLIVITHQKPTMEVADALYGVSMRGDGITTVISQRLARDERV